MKYAIAVEVVKAKQGLVKITEQDRLMEHPMLVEKTGKTAARHPLNKDVDVSSLLDRPIHPHNVRVLQLADQQHLLPDQLLQEFFFIHIFGYKNIFQVTVCIQNTKMKIALIFY